jgi:hypothetical protein
VRRLLMTLALTVALAGISAPVFAHDAYDDSQTHPLRLAAYAVNPAGWALEWAVFRPLHFLVSNPQLERIFGHTPHDDPFSGYSAYEPDEP